MVKQEMMKPLSVLDKVTCFTIKIIVLHVSIIEMKQLLITEIYLMCLMLKKQKKNVVGKISNDRLTVLSCSNADGSHRMPLFVKGKSNNPQCFRSVKSLPVKYEVNSNA